MTSVSSTWIARGRLASSTFAALLLVASGCDSEGGTGSATDASTTSDTTEGATTEDATTEDMTTDGTDGTGGTETPTTTAGVEYGHAADIQPIWDANCTTGCHVMGGSGEAWFIITPDAAYDAMVEANSLQLPAYQLVAPGDRKTSYLWFKLTNTHLDEGGNGTQMPQGADPLSDADLEKIGAWIDQGALP